MYIPNKLQVYKMTLGKHHFILLLNTDPISKGAQSVSFVLQGNVVKI